MRRTWIAGVLAMLALVVITADATAQERFGSLTGAVTDESGAVLPGATVTITSKANGAVRTSTTGSDGRFQCRTSSRADTP